MAKVTEYSRITKMKDNDVLLVDGPDGTRTILQTDASKQMVGEVIMVNETAGDSTKVVINTTDEEIELATMADLEPVEEDVDELKESFNNYDNLKKNIISPTLFQDTIKKPLGEKYWENFNFEDIQGQAYSTIDKNNKEHIFYRSVSCKATEGGTGIIDLRPYVSSENAISLVGVSAFRISVYLEDASLFSQIVLEIIGTSWNRAFDLTNKKNGWNVFTVEVNTGTVNENQWTSPITRFRIYAKGQAGRVMYFDTLQMLRRPKGLIIFVDDSGYKTFYDVGYPQLKNLNVPVTWAIDPVLIGNDASRITQEDLNTLALDGNSEFSFHGYTGNPTSTMTGAELRDDCVSALRYLQKNGLLPKHFWRAAFVQNNAPNYASVVDIVPVLASYNGATSPNIFPFANPHNIPRIALHSQPTGAPELFRRLRLTHCLYVIYTHGVQDTGNYNTTLENWNAFINALQTAINDGYVEGTTYDRLMTSEDY